jgi:hypothetical protein
MSFVSSCPVKNPAELANGPILLVMLQEEGMCCVSPANPLPLSLCERLAPNLPLEKSADQELGDEL